MGSRSLLLTAPYRLEWVAETLPPPGPRQVWVETTAGAISVGTELPQFMGTAREAMTRGYPRMTGYESVGRVAAQGEEARDLVVGTRVIGFYGHRTHALVNAEPVIPVPNGLSDALALLTILMCDVAKGIRTLAPLPQDRVLIAGAGAIGLLTLWTLRAYGVRIIDVLEPRPERRARALRLGAHGAMAPDEDRPHDDYALGFECSSSDAGFARLQAGLRVGGRLCILADGNLEPLTLTPAFHVKELMVVGSSDGWDYPQHARWYFEQVRAGAPELEALFDEDIPVAAIPNIFERMASGAIWPVKVLIRYPLG